MRYEEMCRKVEEGEIVSLNRDKAEIVINYLLPHPSHQDHGQVLSADIVSNSLSKDGLDGVLFRKVPKGLSVCNSTSAAITPTATSMTQTYATLYLVLVIFPSTR